MRRGFPAAIRSCRQEKDLSALPFHLFADQLGYLFRIPGERCPDHIDRIPRFSSVSASVHPMIAFKMVDDGLDLDPLLERLAEPGFLAIRMGMLPFLGNRHSHDSLSPPAVLLSLEGLVKPPVSRHILRAATDVALDAADHLSQGLHIRHVPLILLMGKNQAVVILGQRYQRSELTHRVALALLDDRHVWLVQGVQAFRRNIAGKNLFRLGDDPLSQRDQTIQLTPGFMMAPIKEATDHAGRLLDHPVGYRFEFPDGFLPRFRVGPVKLLDPEQDSFPGSAEGAKGFPKGHLLANPLNLPDDLLLDPVQEIRIRRISDVLGLRRRIHRHTPGLHQTHLRPGPKQDGLDPLHPLRADPVAELDHRGGVQNLTALEGVEPAKALPVGILVQHFHCPIIRAVVPMLQNVDAHHQTNRFAVAANRAVVNRQGFVETIPVDQAGCTQKFVLRIENVRKQGLEHKKLPL
jgi:hypothetical protein